MPGTPDWRPPGPRDWKCDYGTDLTSVHIRPRNDLIWHTADDECPCGPTSEYLDIDTAGCRWLVTHHPLDGRAKITHVVEVTGAPTGDEPDDDGCVPA